MKRNTRYLLTALFLFMLVNSLYGYNTSQEIERERRNLQLIQAERDRLIEIAGQRKTVTDLYRSQAHSRIQEMFQELADSFEKAYNEYNYDLIDDVHERIQIIFRNISSVEDGYIYYEALYNYFDAYIDETQLLFERLINNYPSFNKIKNAVNILQAIYMVRDLNQEYISLYNKFPGISNVKENYWLGHAYCNIGNYEKSQEIFSSLLDDSQYGLRSYISMALVASYRYRYEEAVEMLSEIIDNYDNTTQYYDFTVLTLARLYAQLGFYESSLSLYQEYLELIPLPFTTEMFFEVAIIANEAGNNELALSLLQSIIDLPETSNYFDKAMSQIALIRAESEEYLTYSTELLQEFIKNNVAYDELMALSNEKMMNLQEQVTLYLNDKSNQQDVYNEIYNLLGQVRDAQERRAQFDGFGINHIEIGLIDYFTEEYLLLLQIAVETERATGVIANKSNQSKVYDFNKQISEADTLRIDAYTEIFLYNSPKTNYQEARNIASSIAAYESRLQDITESDDRNNAEVESLKNNIELLLSEAEVLYGSIDYSDEYIQELKYEIDRLLVYRSQLNALKEDAAVGYYQRLAARLRKQNMDRFTENKEMLDFNNQLVDEFRSILNEMILEYNYALLSFQYREVLKMEQAFNLLRQDLERSTTNED